MNRTRQVLTILAVALALTCMYLVRGPRPALSGRSTPASTPGDGTEVGSTYPSRPPTLGDVGCLSITFDIAFNASLGLVVASEAAVERSSWFDAVGDPASSVRRCAVRIDGLRPGLKDLLVFSGSGYLLTTRRLAIYSKAETRETIRLTREEYPQTFQLAGRVVDRFGNPLAGVKYYCWIDSDERLSHAVQSGELLSDETSTAASLRSCQPEETADPYSPEYLSALLETSCSATRLIPSGLRVFANGSVYRFGFTNELGLFRMRVRDARPLALRFKSGSALLTAKITPGVEAMVQLPLDCPAETFEQAYHRLMSALLMNDATAQSAVLATLEVRRDRASTTDAKRAVSSLLHRWTLAMGRAFEFHDENLVRRRQHIRDAGELARDTAEFLLDWTVPLDTTVEPREQ